MSREALWCVILLPVAVGVGFLTWARVCSPVPVTALGQIHGTPQERPPKADPPDDAPGRPVPHPVDTSLGDPLPRGGPRMLSPLSTTVVAGRRPTLRWSPVQGAATMWLERSRTRAFTGFMERDVVTSTRWTPEHDMDSGVWFWRLRWRRSGEFYDAVSPTWTFTVGGGWSPLTSQLDINGDGYTDLPMALPDTHRVVVFYGGPYGLRYCPDAVIESEQPGMFGWVAGTAGDVDGDGYGDLVVSDPAHGTVVIYLGGMDGLSEKPWSVTDSAHAVRSQGLAVAAAGDMQGDGHAFVAMTSGLTRADVAAFSDRDGRTFTWTGVSAQNGASRFLAVIAAGDLDGDGLADVAMNSVGDTAITLFRGSSPTLAHAPDRVLLGVGSQPGVQVASAGDMNGDGRADLAMGDHWGETVVVYPGDGQSTVAVQGVTLHAPQPAGRPVRIMGVGDVNGDGLGDLAIGAQVFAGHPTDSRPTPPWRLPGWDASNPPVIASAGDFNGDGLSDLVVIRRFVTVHPGTPQGPQEQASIVLHPDFRGCPERLPPDWQQGRTIP